MRSRRSASSPAAYVSWRPAQLHSGENIGVTATSVLFVELKQPSASVPTSDSSRIAPLREVLAQ